MKITDPFFLMEHDFDATPLTKAEVVDAARRAKLNPRVVYAMIYNESRFKPGTSLGPTINIAYEGLEHKLTTQNARHSWIRQSLSEFRTKTANNPDNSATIDKIFGRIAWGVGQVMGFNAKATRLTKREFISKMYSGSKGQLSVALRLMYYNKKLRDAINSEDLEGVATYYAGKYWKSYYPQYVTNLRKYMSLYDKAS